MLIVPILIGLICISTCTKIDINRTTIGFYVEDSTELPISVNLGINNKIGEITKVQYDPECNECYVKIDLISDHSYDLIMYGKTKTYEVTFYVPEDRCKTIKFLQR